MHKIALIKRALRHTVGKTRTFSSSDFLLSIPLGGFIRVESIFESQINNDLIAVGYILNDRHSNNVSH